MRRNILASALVLVLAAPALAQPAADIPSITDKVAGMRKLEGFFALYWEDKAGPARFVVPAPQATPPGAPIGAAEYWLPGMVWEGER